MMYGNKTIEIVKMYKLTLWSVILSQRKMKKPKTDLTRVKKMK